MRRILTVAIIGLLSSQAQRAGLVINEQEVPKASAFLDSIANKYELSVEQIRSHTSIDSVYYTGMFSDVGFSGDTVFNLASGLKGAIIDYDDRRSCIYKFLLVFCPPYNQSMAYKKVYSDCDKDESAGYTTLRYHWLNDSTFETTETYTPAKSKIKKIEKRKWRIRNNGTIYSL